MPYPSNLPMSSCETLSKHLPVMMLPGLVCHAARGSPCCPQLSGGPLQKGSASMCILGARQTGRSHQYRLCQGIPHRPPMEARQPGGAPAAPGLRSLPLLYGSSPAQAHGCVRHTMSLHQLIRTTAAVRGFFTFTRNSLWCSATPSCSHGGPLQPCSRQNLCYCAPLLSVLELTMCPAASCIPARSSAVQAASLAFKPH